jgi:hypothetical protein
MKALALVALSCCLFVPDSCDQVLSSSKPSPRVDISDGLVPKTTMCSANHRFERTEVYPVAMRADIALDTCTGELCRTWNWAPKGPGTAWGIYADLSLCSDLPNQH